MTMPEAFIEEDLGASCGAESPSGERQSARSGWATAPWEAQERPSYWGVMSPVRGAGWTPRLIAICHKPHPDAEANARLIAAAPDLLEAAVRALGLLDGLCLPPDGPTRLVLGAAIRKALGTEAQRSEPATTPPKTQDEPNA